MFGRMKVLATVLMLALAVPACSNRDSGTERWATTENTNVKIDWDKVNEAYKLAEGPDDLERRINEIYEGEEVISIAVQDQDAKVQAVTGFFDKNGSGNVDEGEKVFTIQREVTGEGAAQYQTQGYGPYYGYHSPMMSIATGMLMGSMMSSMFSPRYVPVYTQPYTTSAARSSQLRSHRSTYRAQNPSRFQNRSKASGSGRTYNKASRGGGFSGGGGRRGGGSFGIRTSGRTTRPVRLSA
jgi:hypothetical protein